MYLMEQMLFRTLEGDADGIAFMEGSEAYPEIHGWVRFYDMGKETLVMISLWGLEAVQEHCQNHFLGFHIHEGNSCTGNEKDPFADAGMHYNPSSCLHPEHAGDLPPVFNAEGRVFSVFLTSAFTTDEVRGKTVILHGSMDDFKTQPSGNSGEKIACGKIL